MTSLIEKEYHDLLARHGLEDMLEPPGPESARKFAEQLSDVEREFVGEQFVDELRGNGYPKPYRNPLDGAHQDVRRALAASAIDLPGEVYVGEYPHRSFNAHAVAGQNGTLVLLNTGLLTLLDRAGLAFGASLLTFTRLDYGAVRMSKATRDEERLRDSAITLLAESLVAYLSQDQVRSSPRLRVPIDTRRLFGFLITKSAENFAVGHEFGHLLSGHVHQTVGYRDIRDWAAESLLREYEADELAALLLLRSLDESAEFVFRALAVAGPFVFLALDHLITRVQLEIYEIPDGMIERTHPPSDERGAALRAVFMALEDPNTLQIADAAVTWLSGQEDAIIDIARRLLDSSLD